MKTLLQLCCLLPVIAGLLHAEVPRKKDQDDYSRLWTDSPFTSEPVEVKAPEPNPLPKYILLGVSPIKDGYRVTMMNRKRPNAPRLIVETNQPGGGIQISKVLRSQFDPLKTRVAIALDEHEAVIGFEEKFLSLKRSPVNARAQQPKNGVLPGVLSPDQIPSARVPRRRINPNSSLAR